MQSCLLSCKNLTYNIGYKKLFSNLSFSILEGDRIELRGQNGAGKSTLLQIILNFKKEKSIEFPNAKPEAPPLLSYLGHKNGLYSSLSLEENLNFFNQIQKNPASKEDMDFLINHFDLKKKLRDKIQTFSEGMKKKAGLIRTFLCKSDLLLLDEPFNGLDKNSTQVLIELLKTNQYFKTLLIVSHEEKNLHQITNKLFQLDKGEIKCS
jgi:heme exporter protein A